jgi:broad specificity phosphatase PhoE
MPAVSDQTHSRVRIILLRHGRPRFEHRGWIASRQMAAWIERYNQAGIEGDPPVNAVAVTRQAACVVASTLPRSTQSAQLLAIGREVICEPLFREADMPFAAWRTPALPYRVWCAVFRIAWLFGFSARAESRADAVVRAREAAQRLVELARERGPVLLVGHGVMNRLIAEALRARGAVGPRRLRGGYWTSGVYEIIS